MSSLKRLLKYSSLLLIPLWFACSPYDAPPQGPDTGPDEDISNGEDIGSREDTLSSTGSEGDLCRTPGDCDEDLTCVGTSTGTFICMRRCGAEPFCEDSSLCLTSASATTSVCYIGGHRGVGESCDTTLDCMSGARCLASPEAPDMAICYLACSDEHPQCGPDEYCLPSDPRGTCVSRLGKSCAGEADCPFDDFPTCLREPEPDPDPDSEPAPEPFFPEGYCSIEGCTADADCASGLCRFLPERGQRVCLQTCDIPSDCRFYHGYECMGFDLCTSTVDPGACRTFFGGRRLCLAKLPSF